MIRDPAVLREVQEEWRTARATQKMIATNITFSFAGGGYTSPEFRSCAHSMCLLFAFTVLEHVLQQLRYEGCFSCSSSFVGPLMFASKVAIPWVDYPLVNEARDRRNAIAHRQQWIDIPNCEKYLDAIERELRAWSILT